MWKMQDQQMRNALTEIAELMNQVYGERLRSVILYGSAARGTDTEDSLKWKQLLPFYRKVSEEGVILYAA